jgi:hypothetical protein
MRIQTLSGNREGDAMNTVLVFTGRSGVDSVDLRWQLLRVPEVSVVLKSAQSYLERRGFAQRDLISFLQSDANEYLSGGLWREFCAKLIQIGLFRRYERLSFLPKFIIGDSGECSASLVCLRVLTLEDMVENFISELEKRSLEEKSSEFLVGHRLETAKVFELVQGEYVVTSEGKEVWSLLDGVRKDHMVHQVITLGSAQSLGAVGTEQDLGVVESVVVDPLLSWILPYVRAASDVLVNNKPTAVVVAI